MRFLRRPEVQVRLYLGHPPQESGRRRFLHAKCYLVYGGKGQQLAHAGMLNPLIGIVGSSNFTGPGLISNRELNLVHKTLLDEDEVDDPVARAIVSHQADQRVSPNLSQLNKHLLKSEVGVRAIDDLVRWYDDQWVLARDFSSELIDQLARHIAASVSREAGLHISYEMTEALDQRYVSETGDSIREECRRLLESSPLPDR